MNKKICICWSGGIDSTSVLKQYLLKTDYKILVIHVDFRNTDTSTRNVRELKAIEKMLPLMQQIRPFDYKLITVHTPFIKSLDVAIFALQVYGVAKYQKCSEIILSYIKDFHGDEKLHKKGIKILNDAINNMASIFYNLNNYKGISPKFKTPMDGIFGTKAEYMEQIPELLDMVWFCRNPNEVPEHENGCGYCYACKHVMEALKDKYEALIL